jgi:hypothetical protein
VAAAAGCLEKITKDILEGDAHRSLNGTVHGLVNGLVNAVTGVSI